MAFKAWIRGSNSVGASRASSCCSSLPGRTRAACAAILRSGRNPRSNIMLASTAATSALMATDTTICQR